MDSRSDADKWDVNQERVFLENLMQTRFNFFLVVFGLWMVSVASITPKLSKLVFLGFGIVICSLLWLTIRRICQKVIAALGLLKADAKHPMMQVASAAGESRFIRVTSNQLIGYIIPVLCISLFILWFFYIAMSPAEKRVELRAIISHYFTFGHETLLVRTHSRGCDLAIVIWEPVQEARTSQLTV
jgi:hypothetical protein